MKKVCYEYAIVSTSHSRLSKEISEEISRLGRQGFRVIPEVSQQGVYFVMERVFEVNPEEDYHPD
jgi:hypothetical protein